MCVCLCLCVCVCVRQINDGKEEREEVGISWEEKKGG